MALTRRLSKIAYFKAIKWVPIPSKAEQHKIRLSLGMPANMPFMRCPGKSVTFVRACEAKGDFSHSGPRKQHICEKCRCKRTAGQGTKHYGVGYCYYHDINGSRVIAKSMAIALQQGYPLDPIKYRTETEYIDQVREQAEQAQGRLSVGEEINLVRAHLQEFELMWRKVGAEGMTMRAGTKVAPMTDDVKLELLVKLADTVSKLTRDSYVITESDYCHIDEIKVWLWEIWQCIQRNINRMLCGDLKDVDLEAAIKQEFKLIPLPKTGRKNK